MGQASSRRRGRRGRTADSTEGDSRFPGVPTGIKSLTNMKGVDLLTSKLASFSTFLQFLRKSHN